MTFSSFNDHDEITDISRYSLSDAIWDDRWTVRVVECGPRDVRLASWVEAAGMRLLGWLAPRVSHDWSSETSDLVIIDVMTEAADTEMLVRSLVCAVASAEIRIVVKTTLVLLEPIMQWLGPLPATILCSPRDEEAISSLIGLVRSNSAAALHGDLGPGNPAAVGPPAWGSDNRAREAEVAELPFDEDDQVSKLVADPAAFARQIEEFVRLRSIRSQLFGEDLFQDPVWNMLLDLMIARLRGRRTSVTSLCIAAGVSETTALRLIGTLTRRGVLVRKDDELDGRRVFIEFANKYANAMVRWLLAATALPRRCRL